MKKPRWKLSWTIGLSHIESLDTPGQIDFLQNQMNASVEMDGSEVSYEVCIPEGIIELATK